jgi:hypothetical protein
MAINFCHGCFEKQIAIDRLEQENARLRQKLRYEERRGKEGFFGSSTPSSKLPVKTNIPAPTTRKPRGAMRGHQGNGRKLVAETASATMLRASTVGRQTVPSRLRTILRNEASGPP